VSSVIFGTTLLLLYTFSTLYHSIQRPRVKTIMRTLDHSAIFLLIAGSYTPFTLVNLRGPWGWSLFAAVWILAVLGILLQFTVLKKWRGITIGIYIFMGWAVVIAIKQMLATVAPMGMILLLAGGISYTFGVVFYLWKKLPYNHAVWHLFVLAGSTLHFLAVLLYAVPLG
jgi:hemolysin III